MSDTPPQLDYSRKSTRTWRDEMTGEFRRFTGTLTRENIISNLKTLAWVIPLTLLIWIWAEREQVQPASDVAVPFELTSVDPNRVVSLRGTDPNLVLELSGPQARLQELLNRLRGGQMPQGLKLDVPTTYGLNREATLVTMELLNNTRLFRDYGVTVQRVQPTKLDVSIDALVEREAKIALPPNAKNINATFDPPTVKVRGPENLLNRAAQASPERGQLIVYASTELLPRTPGHFGPIDAVLVAPDDLKDDRVRINDAKVKVAASGNVNLADKTFVKNSMPVTVDVSFSTAGKYVVECDRPSVPNVSLTGTPDIIDAIQKPEFDPQPKARLVVTAADLANVGERRSKAVEYDLPEGVHVSPEDRKKTVEFRIIERSATPAS